MPSKNSAAAKSEATFSPFQRSAGSAIIFWFHTFQPDPRRSPGIVRGRLRDLRRLPGRERPDQGGFLSHQSFQRRERLNLLTVDTSRSHSCKLSSLSQETSRLALAWLMSSSNS